MGRFYNCGQACLAIKRVYVFESVADEVIESIAAKAKRLKLGRGDAEGSQMGPLHTAAQRDEVAGQVERTLAMGGDAGSPAALRPTTPTWPTGSSTRRPSSSTRRTTRRWRPRRSSGRRCRSGA